jgi:hypothetical protein
VTGCDGMSANVTARPPQRPSSHSQSRCRRQSAVAPDIVSAYRRRVLHVRISPVGQGVFMEERLTQARELVQSLELQIKALHTELVREISDLKHAATPQQELSLRVPEIARSIDTVNNLGKSFAQHLAAIEQIKSDHNAIMSKVDAISPSIRIDLANTHEKIILNSRSLVLTTVIVSGILVSIPVNES